MKYSPTNYEEPPEDDYDEALILEAEEEAYMRKYHSDIDEDELINIEEDYERMRESEELDRMYDDYMDRVIHRDWQGQSMDRDRFEDDLFVPDYETLARVTYGMSEEEIQKIFYPEKTKEPKKKEKDADKPIEPTPLDDVPF